MYCKIAFKISKYGKTEVILYGDHSADLLLITLHSKCEILVMSNLKHLNYYYLNTGYIYVLVMPKCRPIVKVFCYTTLPLQPKLGRNIFVNCVFFQIVFQYPKFLFDFRVQELLSSKMLQNIIKIK